MMKTIRSAFYYIIPLAIFLSLAAYLLLGKYPDMLYTAQDRNEFFSTSDFFCRMVSEPFGLMSYLGCYLTQYFFHSTLGVLLLLLLWSALYGATIKAFSLTPHLAPLALLPLACLCVSLTDVGYWIYILPLRGYWFSETLAVLIAMLMLWAARSTSARYRAVWYLIGSVVAFPFIGWCSYLFALCFFVTQCAESADRRMSHVWWLQLCGVILTAFIPLNYARFIYTEMNLPSVLKAGIPYFESTTVSAIRPSYPFMLLVLFLLLLAACLPLWRRVQSKSQEKHASHLLRNYAGLTLSILLIAVSVQQVFGFRDYNYQAEMRMNQAAMEDDWQTIISEAERCSSPSRTMVVLKNIALMNTGELGTRSYMLDNSGLDINNVDSLNLNIMQIASPLIYFQYGKVQYAIRWAMENALSYGYSPYYMKIFLRAAQETGEQRLMKRYYHLMSLTTFHGDWRPLPPSKLVRDLHVAFSDVIDSDNNDIERYLIQNFYMAFGSNKEIVQELNLFYAMIYRDPQYFWPAFNTFAQLFMKQKQQPDGSMSYRAELPMHYQEAYLIMQENYPVNLPYEVAITPMVQQSYQLYKQAVGPLQQQGVSENEIGEKTRDAWKHTYWWYLMYGRKSY